LSVDDVVRSTIELGRLTGHQREATKLALKLQRRLSRPIPPDAPRVLLVLGYAGLGSQQLWFVKRNSIHGKALTAAGARNAIDRDVLGPPTLSPERLMLVDPDAIIVLASGDGEASLQPIRRLTQLSAVRHERIGVINDPAALIPGPRILTLVDKLEALTDSLEARR
jgi:iron complex transport system substrate-binding protein